MVSPFIATSINTTTKMLRYTGAAAAGVGGSSLPASDTGYSVLQQPSGRVIRFNGLNTYIATAGSAIYRSTDGGNSWTLIFSLPSISATNAAKSGFTITYINGIPYLVMFYADTSSFVRMAYSSDGLNWTTVTNSTIIGAVGYNQTLAVAGTVYMGMDLSGSGKRIAIGSPASNSLSLVTITGAATGVSPDIVQYNNRIIVLYYLNTGGFAALGEVVSGSWVPLLSVTGGIGVPSSGHWAMFVDGGFIYIIVYSSVGFQAYEINTTITGSTNISSTVLPSALLGAVGSALPITSRIRTVIDDVSTPGTVQIYLYVTTTDTTTASVPWAAYRWNGSGSLMTLVNQGGSSNDALPFFKNAQGTYFVSDSVFPSTVGITVEIIDRTFTASGVRLSFKLYGSQGSVSFRVYYGDVDAEYPLTLGTLSNPSVGTISGGNTNTGLTADNGATTYLVTWDAQTDGFDTNEQFRLVGDAFA